jgi:hypothetical protein
MGIPLPVAHLIAGACRRNNVRGRCLTLGRQDVNLTVDDLVSLLIQIGYMEKTASGDVVSSRPDIMENMKRVSAANQDIAVTEQQREQQWISDKLLFAGLGFSEMHSLDVSSFDGAEITHDLNQPGLGARIERPYDFVLDGGTLEHVFDVRTVLRNLFEAVAVGGYIMHMAPSNNHVDHGFYQFSPTFFYDYYATNNYRIDSIKFFRHSRDVHNVPWKFWDYQPGALESTAFGGLDGGMYGVAACVQRTGRSTWDKIPQQGAYRKLWATGT